MSNNGITAVLLRLLDSGDYSDLMFVCNGQEFKVHKSIVCGQSAVIKAALQEQFQESENSSIVMDGFDPSTVKKLIQFLYSGDYQGADDEKTRPEKKKEAKEDKTGSSHDSDHEADNESTAPVPPLPKNVSTSQESAAEAPPKALAKTALTEHIRVNSIADYYGIDALVSLSNTKIKWFLDGSKAKYWAPILPAVVQTAVNSTGDKGVLDLLASAIAENINCVDLNEFEGLGFMSDFSIRVLKSCAKEIQALTSKSFEKRRRQETSEELIYNRFVRRRLPSF